MTMAFAQSHLEVLTNGLRCVVGIEVARGPSQTAGFALAISITPSAIHSLLLYSRVQCSTP